MSLLNVADTIDQAVARTGLPLDQLRTLPLLSRKTAWMVLIDALSAQPLGFVVLVRFEAQIGLSPLCRKRKQL